MAAESPRPGRVAIVVDSAATLPEEALASPQVHVAPMSLTLAGRTYLDGEDVSPSEFYRMLRASPSPPTTSAPSPEAFLDAYRRAARSASSILCLTVAASVSASYDSATVAARMAADALPGVTVRVLDSESAAGGQGLAALEALRSARAGAGLEKVAGVASRAISRVRLLAFPDTLYYLWKRRACARNRARGFGAAGREAHIRAAPRNGEHCGPAADAEPRDAAAGQADARAHRRRADKRVRDARRR